MIRRRLTPAIGKQTRSAPRLKTAVALHRPNITRRHTVEIIGAVEEPFVWNFYDDFDGDLVNLTDASPGPVTASHSGSCGERTMDSYLPSYGLHADVNDGFLEFHDGSHGPDNGYLLTEWTCAMGDITQGGAANCVRIHISAMDFINPFGALVGATIELKFKTNESDQFGDAVEVRADVSESSFNSHGAAYIDFLFPTWSNADPDNIGYISLDIKCSGLADKTWLKIESIGLACSGLSSSGDSSDGSGGPNDGACP